MDQDKLKELFEDKYQAKLGITIGQWLESAPETEDEAYRRLNEIDAELSATYDQWFEAKGEEKEHLEEHRQKLKAEYDLLEELFALEARDKEW